MPSSRSCGLAFIWIAALLFLLAQGQQPSRRDHHSYSPVNPGCCPEAKTDPFNGLVVACYEQKPYKFPLCKIHAYIFITNTNKTHCVDPDAKWLNKRLEKLEKRGIYCKEL